MAGRARSAPAHIDQRLIPAPAAISQGTSVYELHSAVPREHGAGLLQLAFAASLGAGGIAPPWAVYLAPSAQAGCVLPCCRGNMHDALADSTSRAACAEVLKFGGIPGDVATGFKARPALARPSHAPLHEYAQPIFAGLFDLPNVCRGRARQEQTVAHVLGGGLLCDFQSLWIWGFGTLGLCAFL